MPNKAYLFPLSKISLQEGTRKPLNIFEPRYLEMVKDSIEKNIPIALAFAHSEDSLASESTAIVHEHHSYVRKTVCMGVPEIVQECSDGTMVILLTGTLRGTIMEVLDEGTPYLVCEFTPKASVQELKAENILLLRRLKTKLEKWVGKMVKLECQKDHLKPCLTQPERVVGLYIELLVESPETKQLLLEMDDINEKIQYLIFNS
ncbi:putative protease [Halobacteriovorax marinus SJ]|uniref:Protease n=1 Tax=Halobacteriovorax marinus (strain ATCC BAA-682 / DSM 15412 / SJ) TaxID=862908 RepID=E1WXH4_HALMS|nr:LON peptidase substrate-binding domain-containing protein [Halobacteriovorax marinus]CBW27491.1 putative protease [Halobacteriovorax marinus SJ]